MVSVPGIKGILLERAWLILVFISLIFIIYSGLIYYQYVLHPPKQKSLLVARNLIIKTNLFESIKRELNLRESNLKQVDQDIYADPFR